jgi:hypothetical protein
VVRRAWAKVPSPGVGNSTVARRLPADLGLPCLASDTLGPAIQASCGVVSPEAVDASWVGYDLVFRLAEEAENVYLHASHSLAARLDTFARHWK